MMKKTLSFILTLATLLGLASLGISAGENSDYPELIITEMSCDTYGDAANAKNTNANYRDTNAGRDAYEFIEIYNNSDRSLNIFDYMLAYQGTGSGDADYFESSVQEYTPFFPGKDWIDAPIGNISKYWKNSKVAMPENPAYENGTVKAGEVIVVWMYSENSHLLNCTTEQFRKFWGIEDSVKVFLLDADSTIDEMNFNLKNENTGTYMIMVQSERFPKRRSADKKYYPESDNTHHNYFKKTYEELDEIVNWAVIDYKTEPLKSFAAANGGANSTTNFTISFIPETGSNKAENGYLSSSFKSAKRSHLDKINLYAEATPGKLNDAQKSALSGKATSKVKAVATTDVYTDPENNTTRPDLLITRISPDQYGNNPGNINAKYSKSSGADVFELIELYNNSGKKINIFDYMLGYQGAGATSVSTYFEKLIQEYTAFLPGVDWIDAPYGSYDSYWTAGAKMPVNLSYAEGWLEPGEIIEVWMYSQESHKVNATVAEFRSFWQVPAATKVVLFDANSSIDKNFNIKNSDTGTYVVMKPSTNFPQRRSDDSTLYTEDPARFWSLDKSYNDVAEVVSWAVVDFGQYEPLYTFSKKNTTTSFTTNYTLQYAPADPDAPSFTNGFLTVSFASLKRCQLLNVESTFANAGIGTLTEGQKGIINKVMK